MRQIRFLGVLFTCLVLFASTGFGQIPEKTLKISNKSTFTAYCAYSYVVDAETAAYGEKIGFHVKGWVSVPSGRAEYIQYRSKFKPNVYFILENDLEINGDEKQASPHYIPAPLLDAIKAERKPSAEKFEILEGLETGEIVSVSGADEFNMKVRPFYPGKNVVIPGPVEIVELQEMEEFDGEYSRLGFVRSGTDYALLFATNDYFPFNDDEHHGEYWPDLETPIRDATILKQELDKYGFKVDIKDNLKTRADILGVIEDYAKKDYEPGDQLFVYFAGHGDFYLNNGYIAAGDSKLPKYDSGMSSYLAYGQLKDLLDRIDCDRVMLTLDVCYGGTFDDNIALSPGPITRGPDDAPAERGVVQKLNLQNTLKVRTRWYLSSGGKEEVLDGMAGANSPFALALVSILRNGAGKDGVLTIPEVERQLYPTLRSKLNELEAAWKEKEPLWDGKIQQTPVSGPFESGKHKAFVFIKR